MLLQVVQQPHGTFKGMAGPHEGVLCLGGCDAKALLLQDMEARCQ